MITLRGLLFIFLLGLMLPLLPSCTTTVFDPGRGAETVFVRTMENPQIEVSEYLNEPSEGQVTTESDAWTLFWFFPLNRPDLGVWLEETLPENAAAANVQCRIKRPWYGHLLFFPTLGILAIDRVAYSYDPVRLKYPKPIVTPDPADSQRP